MARKLNSRQELFAREYVVDYNATQAAIRAGYAPSGAEANGSKLTRLDKVRDLISKFQKEKAEMAQVDAQQVIAGLTKIAFADHREMYDEDGRMLDPAKFPGSIAAAVAGVEQTKFGLRVKLNDRLRALELLGKHLGMFVDRVQTDVRAVAQVQIYLPDNGRHHGC